MTEDEAKTKWCPMVRFHLGEIAHYSNREETADKANKASRCIASNCMMWVPTGNECSAVNECIPVERRAPQICKPAGYCGLAGKP